MALTHRSMTEPTGNSILAAITDRDLDRLHHAIRAGADLGDNGLALLRSAIKAELTNGQARPRSLVRGGRLNNHGRGI